MAQSKPVYKSKTVYGVALLVAGGLFNLWGYGESIQLIGLGVGLLGIRDAQGRLNLR